MWRLLTRGFAWLCIYVGIFLAMFVVYQLWYTDVRTGRSQAEALEEIPEAFEARRIALPEPDVDEGPVLHPESFDGLEGEVVARIVIPEIDLDAAVYQGVGTEVLRLGPGHMPDTAVPGQPGNAVISGHRVTYGRPFHDVDALDVGSQISVETALGAHTYEVRRIFVVPPWGVWVTEPLPGSWLTLTACHPRFSARERIIVQAELVEGVNLEYARYLAETDPPPPVLGEPLEILTGEL